MRLCTVKGRKAMFHCWEHGAAAKGSSSAALGESAGRSARIRAVIESEDGTVESVSSCDIIFNDTAKLISKVEKEIAKWEGRQAQNKAVR